jgi:hypothetical protein
MTVQKPSFGARVSTWTSPKWAWFKPRAIAGVVGAVLMWGILYHYGWMSSGAANRMAADAAQSATVAILTPDCVHRFVSQDGGAAQVEALKKAGSWEQRGIVEKSGFANLPGEKEANSALAMACTTALAGN